MGMQFTPLDPKAGTEQTGDLIYGQGRLGGKTVPLLTDLYLPRKRQRPAPLLVWMGRDVLSLKEANRTGPRILAGMLTRDGIAVAAPRIRAEAGRADIRNEVIEALPGIERYRDNTVSEQMSSFPALAGMEDLCALLNWATAEGAEYGLSGQFVLAGSGAGAAMAFNTACVAPSLGLDRPAVLGVISFSGTCAWPGLFEAGKIRVFALHNPNDRRIRIEPVRAMAAKDERFELIECIEQAHGSLGLWPSESPQDACARIASRVIQWAG